MSELSYRTLRENVVSELRMKILSRELAPGTRIVEQNLSREFGISRGPIREALRQLEQEGLVAYTRNAGCSVKKIAIADVYEIYLLRSSYEALAVRLCGGKFSPEELEEMERVLKTMRTLTDGDFAGLVDCDHSLHGVIVRKSRLPRLMKAWEELNYGSIIASVNSPIYNENLASRQYAIHRELIDSIRSEDTDVICRAIYSHYMLTVKRMIMENHLDMEDFIFLCDE